MLTRETNLSDINLDTFVYLFDTTLTSTDPFVRKANATS